MREKSLESTRFSRTIAIALSLVCTVMLTTSTARSETQPEISSGTYTVAPGAVVSLTGGIAGDTRFYGIYGEIEIGVDYDHPQTLILTTRLSVKPEGLTAMPFPADDLLELTELSGEVVSHEELRFRQPDENVSQTAELVVTATESGLLLNGTYSEGCCDRYLFTFTDVELTPVAGMDGIYLPGVASINGENGSQWQSDVTIFHTGRGAATITMTYVAEDGEEPFPWLTFDLDPGGARTFSDVLSFFPDSAGSKGYLIISSSYNVPIVTATTYNVAAEGTYGQNLAPFTREQCIAAGDRAFLIGMSSSGDLSSGHRSNVGLLNTSQTDEAEVWIFKDYPPDKSGLYSSKAYTLAPGQFIQRNIYNDLGYEGEAISSPLRVEVGSGGPVAVYGSVIDNVTQDPRLVVAQHPVWKNRHP